MTSTATISTTALATSQQMLATRQTMGQLEHGAAASDLSRRD
jgi:hypothetical protein